MYSAISWTVSSRGAASSSPRRDCRFFRVLEVLTDSNFCTTLCPLHGSAALHRYRLKLHGLQHLRRFPEKNCRSEKNSAAAWKTELCSSRCYQLLRCPNMKPEQPAAQLTGRSAVPAPQVSSDRAEKRAGVRVPAHLRREGTQKEITPGPFCPEAGPNLHPDHDSSSQITSQR